VALHVEEDGAWPERLDDARQPVAVERTRARGLERLDSRQRDEPGLEAPSISKRSRPSPFGTPSFIRVTSRLRFL
jgi:hypothetical protein